MKHVAKTISAREYGLGTLEMPVKELNETKEFTIQQSQETDYGEFLGLDDIEELELIVQASTPSIPT